MHALSEGYNHHHHGNATLPAPADHIPLTAPCPFPPAKVLEAETYHCVSCNRLGTWSCLRCKVCFCDTHVKSKVGGTRMAAKDGHPCKTCGFLLQESKLLSLSVRRHEYGRQTKEDWEDGKQPQGYCGGGLEDQVRHFVREWGWEWRWGAWMGGIGVERWRCCGRGIGRWCEAGGGGDDGGGGNEWWVGMGAVHIVADGSYRAEGGKSVRCRQLPVASQQVRIQLPSAADPDCNC